MARLTDGKTISGTLAAWDSYTLTLNVAGHAEPFLIYTHALAFVVRKTE